MKNFQEKIGNLYRNKKLFTQDYPIAGFKNKILNHFDGYKLKVTIIIYFHNNFLQKLNHRALQKVEVQFPKKRST